MGKTRKLKYCQECGGKLSKVLTNGRERMKCNSCNNIAYENPVPATAAIVFNKAGELLLVKRNVEPKIGEWCLPGGFTEIGETPEECCQRELEEETGLKGVIGRIIGSVPGINPFYRSVLVTGYSIIEYSGKLSAGDDSDEARFFKLSKIPPIAFKSHRELLDLYIDRERYEIDKSVLQKMGAYVITSENHIKVAEEAYSAGVKIIQYRDKKSTRAEKLKIAESICKITRRSETLFIVNDDIDIALISGADGVHLGQDDISISQARKIVPRNFIIGKSTHSLEQALKAESDGADYIGIGPVFKTPTKKDYIPIGVKTVKQVIDNVKIPFVCIGGLNLNNIQELIDLGVVNFAMVREFAENTKKSVEQINKLISGN